MVRSVMWSSGGIGVPSIHSVRFGQLFFYAVHNKEMK